MSKRNGKANTSSTESTEKRNSSIAEVTSEAATTGVVRNLRQMQSTALVLASDVLNHRETPQVANSVRQLFSFVYRTALDEIRLAAKSTTGHAPTGKPVFQLTQ